MLNKKERARYSKLIAKKLILMGIKDEVVYQATGSKKTLLKRTPDGNVIIGENGPEMFSHEMLQMVNPHRRLLKNLLDSNVPAIKAFLALDVNSLSGITKAVSETENDDNSQKGTQ